MPIGSPGADFDPRTIHIETARVLGHEPSHYGVIDVGSNSMRLVVYDDLSRAPFPRFNEKSLVALGEGLDADGAFTKVAMDRALAALGRFKAISDAMGVGRVDVIATEAMRRATNGSDLLARIEAETGFRPRLLSGAEEATHAALGVISGFFQPRGLVGDIGGGSLEIAEVLGDHVGERKVSMPLGALPVRAMLEQGQKASKKQVDEILDAGLPPLLTEPVFYAVGGGWRALARIHMAMTDWPIGVVHGYELPAEEILELAKSVARMSPEEVAELPDVPGRRVDTLSASALVMWRLLRKLEPERVVFSALGLREGWLYAQLGEAERYRDPLIEGALAIGLRDARVPQFSEALGQWTEDLFPGETQSDRRLRLAVCALTDIAWRDHQKIRAAESFMRILQFPFIGISHPERAFLATAIMSRYGGKPAKLDTRATEILSPTAMRKAEVLGRALLLGHRFSASVPDILGHSSLRIESDAVRLGISRSSQVPDSDTVRTRLFQLARVLDMEAAIDTPAS
ncbi:exopolyphosphatase/guanosine-5'-triphosphate,3'-diphosphate pyrophosphatase [Aliiruegeria haliotis]|uniref:Exopolyphosphatase/guanosine-5'-triphosphate, 3'-diphosphate pyrophosphatase n=1 Tax=Aliiruegeria haliotis TaxID=1280846 RepID=A0A2T0RUZ1_9RHOB|nr:Ppx/GppA phosphatase family protein [Aliiruegeria haliotis]PRY25001.1 exopolyphosphatase/guanosine-5'-triphosphate,3'-diphosphate pyrophosphatase [Aliiruegeria haliotis]